MSDPNLATVATLGGGCFWCLDAALRQLDGVISCLCGYAGGQVDHPTYRQVCAGTTGHAEVLRITFVPEQLDYRTLLTAFFSIHDPTTLDRQGHDIGSQYRSIILTHDEAQAATARTLIAELTAQQIWADPIVTAIQPVGPFWPAEAEHQDYYRHHPNQPYCQAVVAPKVAKLRQRFANRLKSHNG